MGSKYAKNARAAAATVVLRGGRASSTPLNPLVGFEGPSRRGKERENGRKGGEKKGT